MTEPIYPRHTPVTADELSVGDKVVVRRKHMDRVVDIFGDRIPESRVYEVVEIARDSVQVFDRNVRYYEVVLADGPLRFVVRCSTVMLWSRAERRGEEMDDRDQLEERLQHEAQVLGDREEKGMSNVNLIDRFDKEMHKLVQRVTPLLPEWPETGVCECGSDSWMLIEPGYWRFTAAETETAEYDAQGFLHATTDGRDDMSESGATMWVACNTCDLAYTRPREIEYD